MSSKKVILSGMIGNAFEWYDYALYGALSYIIKMLYFPTGNEYVGYMAVFGVYAVGFFMRPIGAIFFGYIGDKYGRRASLSISILMMAIPTTAIGILPTYDQIGLYAPAMLILIRLFQGMSMGGEFGGSMVFIVEHAPADKRGLHGSFTICSLAIGVMLGSLVASFFSHTLSHADFMSWGWRIPFLLGAPIAVVGYYIRSGTHESDLYTKSKESGEIPENPTKRLMSNYKALIMIGIGLSVTVCVPFHCLTAFMPHAMSKKMSVSSALFIGVIDMAIVSVISIFSGYLSDKYGRKPIMSIGAIGVFAWVYPAFCLIYGADSGFSECVTALSIFSVFFGIFFGTVPSTLVELFPTSVRFTGLSLSYNLSITIFGGTFPIVAAWLQQSSGIDVSVAIYIMFANFVTLVSIYFLKESYKLSLQ